MQSASAGPTIEGACRRRRRLEETTVDLEQPTARLADGGWSWAPYSPEEAGAPRFLTESWAPASTVRHPWLRLGRWTLVYRRPAD
jgi:hypothetical protein